MKRLFQHNIHGRVLSVLLAVTVGSGTLVMAPYVAAGTGGAADANAAAIPIAADGALDNLTEITPEEASRYLSGNNAAQAAPKVTIESFASDTKTIPVGEAKSVVFTAKLTCDGILGEQDVKVVDGDGSLIGSMRDDGQEGDEAAGDGTYTLRVSLSPDKEQTVSYHAAAEGAVSPSVSIGCYVPLNSADLNRMEKADNEIKNVVTSETFRGKSDGEKAETVGKLLKRMADDGEVKADSIRYSERSNEYYFEYSTSVPCVIVLDERDKNYNGAAPAGSDVINAMTEKSDAGAASETNAAAEAPVGSGYSAIVLNAFENSVYRRSFYEELQTDWNGRGLTTTVDTYVTVADLKNLGSYDVIVFAMHGSMTDVSGTGEVPAISLNEAATSYTDSQYEYELRTRKSIRKAYYTDETTYLVAPGFFTDNYSGGGLSGKLVYSESCEFYGADAYSTSPNYTFANALRSCSAGAVVGYHNSVYADYSRDMMKYVVEVTFEGEEVGEAVSKAKGVYGNNDGGNPGAYPVVTPTNSSYVLRYETLPLNTTKTVNIDKAGTAKYFKYTPSSALSASFYSTGSSDTCGYLYSAGKTQLAYDDDGGTDHNFKITYSLSAGATYIFACKFLGSSKTGSFQVRLEGTVPVQKKSIANCTITLNPTSFVFNNTPRTPTVTVKDGSTTLKKNTHYTVTYENNVNVGTARAIIKGIGDYEGQVTKTFTISYANLALDTDQVIKVTTAGDMRYFKFVPSANMEIKFYSTGSCDTYGYLYNASLGQLASNDDGGEDHNFCITYSVTANTTYVVACKLYSSTATGNFYVKIKRNGKPISDCTVTLNTTSYIFNNKERTPAVTVKDGSTTLTKNTHYTVKYENNINVGTGRAIVTGIENAGYTGSVTKTFTISYANLALDTDQVIKVTTAGDMRYFKFVPTANMEIKFFSTGSCDTYGYLYNASLNQLASNDDGGEDHNFSITYSVTANTTYVVACKLFNSSSTGNFYVKIKRSTKPISDCTVTLNTTSYIFNNKARTPAVTVKDGSTTLTKNSHYTVKYENNVNVGTGRAIVTGIESAGYSGSVTKTFTISYANLALDTNQVIKVTTAGDMRYFKFVPTANMEIKFFSTGSCDTYGYLYNASLNQLASNDDGGENNNFKITYSVQANTTYVVACRLCSSSATGNFYVKITRNAKPISGCTVTLNPTSFTYNGKERRPAVTVKDGSTTLEKNKDYTVTYENNVNVGTARAIISGINTYAGSITKPFTISYANLAMNTDQVIKITTAGDMRYFKFVPTANMIIRFYSTGSCDTYGYLYNASLSQLASNDDSGENNNFSITYSVTANTTYVVACRLCSSTATGNFYVKLKRYTKPISECTITLNTTSYIFNNKARTPAVIVKDGSTTLVKNTHYTVRYENNTNVGTARVIITGIEDAGYSGSVTKTFTIAYANLAMNTDQVIKVTTAGDMRYFKFVPSSNMKIRFYSTGSCDTYGYLYSAGLNLLSSDDDSGADQNFNITYNVEANTTYVVACKLYNASATGSFYVKLVRDTKPIANCTVTLNTTSFAYNGKERYPAVTVKDGSVTLTKNSDYTVRYEDNINVGTGRAIVTGTGSYSGTVTKTFTIAYSNLALNTDQVVNIGTAGDVRYFKFVPSSGMTIRFYSTGSCDTYGYLYNADMTQLLKSDDDGGENQNFSMTYYVTANTTYIVACKLFGSSATGSFYVKIKNNAANGVDLERLADEETAVNAIVEVSEPAPVVNEAAEAAEANEADKAEEASFGAVVAAAGDAAEAAASAP